MKEPYPVDSCGGYPRPHSTTTKGEERKPNLGLGLWGGATTSRGHPVTRTVNAGYRYSSSNPGSDEDEITTVGGSNAFGSRGKSSRFSNPAYDDRPLLLTPKLTKAHQPVEGDAASSRHRDNGSPTQVAPATKTVHHDPSPLELNNTVTTTAILPSSASETVTIPPMVIESGPRPYSQIVPGPRVPEEAKKFYIGGDAPMFIDEKPGSMPPHTRNIRNIYSCMIWSQVGPNSLTLPRAVQDALDSSNVKTSIQNPIHYDGADDVDLFDDWLRILLRWFSIQGLAGCDLDDRRVQLMGHYLEGKAVKWFEKEVMGAFKADPNWWFEKAVIGLYHRFVHSAHKKAAERFEHQVYSTEERVSGLFNDLCFYAQRTLHPPPASEFAWSFYKRLPEPIKYTLCVVNEITAVNSKLEDLRDAAVAAETNLLVFCDYDWDVFNAKMVAAASGVFGDVTRAEKDGATLGTNMLFKAVVKGNGD